MPLFFQAVKLDSPSAAGLRMVAPALATPFGGLTTGFAMTRYGNGCLKKLTRVGMTFMMVCAMLLLHLGQSADTWRYSAVLVPGNFGQGIAYPSILFAFIQGFDFEGPYISFSH